MKKIMLAVVAALSVGGACAEPYLGAGLTMSTVNVNCAGKLTCTHDGAGAKIYGGYMGKSGIGGELVYLQLGTAKTTTATTNTDYEASGVAAALVMRGTVSRSFFVNAKLGLARVTTTAKARTAAAIQPDYSESTTKPYLSLGAEYGFVENVKLTAFVDSTKGKIYGDSAAIHSFGLGVEFLF
ncbi:MAG: outer membrane beta-barrel protein [Burkholderiales bacterium]|nr:outer membrane beta-barrel protein [Burkholderiales bacterium]